MKYIWRDFVYVLVYYSKDRNYTNLGRKDYLDMNHMIKKIMRRLEKEKLTYKESNVISIKNSNLIK